jgi:hypothetical protein
MGSNHVRHKRFSLLQKSTKAPEPTRPPIQWAPAFFPADKVVGV